MTTEPAAETPPVVMFEDSLWWNFQRFCRLHGYVMTDMRGDNSLVYVHKPGHEKSAPPQPGHRYDADDAAGHLDQSPINEKDS